MSGCRDAWSSTRPRTNRESAPSLCSMVITSTMCRSTAKLPSSSSSRTVRTASTTAPVMRSAIFGWSFVRSAVRATLWRSSRGGFFASTPTAHASRISSALSRARS